MQSAKAMPHITGKLSANVPIGKKGWFQAGGNAETVFKPSDIDDLQNFLTQRDEQSPIQTFGALSNTIIRDGGLPGLTIRLGRAFAQIQLIGEHTIFAGAMALDKNVALFAADKAIAGLEFYSGIPGTIGGALRMNAGCYGTETKDVLLEAHALDFKGNLHKFTPDQMGLSYRHNDLPQDYIFIGAILRGESGNSVTIKNALSEIRERREQSQPIREKTGGSTFANPSLEDLQKAGLQEDTKVWQLIDRVGGRGLRVGGAQMSEKHCNFMINTGNATGADLENLGEEIRRRVMDETGISLRWEIRRVGLQLVHE